MDTDSEEQYPAWTGHRDRRGIPIYVYEIQGLTSKAVTAYEKETAAYKANLPHHKDLPTPAKHLPLFALYHNLLNFVLPLCSALERPQPEVPVTNSTNIVDIKGVSLRQFWNLKTHMQDASVLATARYPETLDRIFVCISSPHAVIGRAALTLADHWCTLILSDSLELDQRMVRSCDGLEDIHPLEAGSKVNVGKIHGPQRHT